MATVTQPPLIPRPWASNGAKDTIPDTTAQFGRASWSAGFPSETAQPLGAGGIPPNWLDFQGVLYALSQHATFEQVGGRYAWSNTQNYPVGACIIGSNGMVYQALQESGPGTSAGAKTPTSSGNSAYWGPSATPDGTTIVVQNGKLTAVAQGDADSLADNITTVANNGKLTVDLSNVTAAALKKVTQHEIDAEGGLVMDSTTGLLSVDFDAMPLDRIYALLRALKMQIPLTSDLQLYVDGNPGAGSDTMVDGRGSRSLPFATIQACINYATQSYALGLYKIYINIMPLENNILYNEHLLLPTFTRTTGSIIMRPTPGEGGALPAQTLNITDTALDRPVVACNGGQWELRNINLWGKYSGSGSGYHRSGTVSVNGSATVLTLCGCGLDTQYTGAAPSGDFWMYNIAAYNGAIVNLQVIAGAQNRIVCDLGNASGAYALYAERDAHIYFPTDTISTTAAQEYNIPCSGAVTAFARPSSGSSIESYGTGTKQQFTGSMTGKYYAISTGSSAIAPPGGFPGNDTGTLDTSTYCWYQEQS